MKGIITALLVSFDDNGQINEQGTREIVRYNLDVMKVDGLYVNGSSGETFMLSTEEKKRVFDIVYDEVNGQVPLIAQVGSINLQEAVELAKYATDLGYNALSAVTPFYYKFSFEEIKHYYNTIIDAADNDMIVYSIPVLTGVSMSLEQFGELFENPRIIGVKFTAGDFYLLERMRQEFPNHLLYGGFDEMLLSASVLGIDGAIGSTFNVSAKLARSIYDAAAEGRIAEARAVQHQLNDFITALISNGLYQTLKEILSTQGVHAGICREPMRTLTTEQQATAKSLFDNYLA